MFMFNYPIKCIHTHYHKISANVTSTIKLWSNLCFILLSCAYNTFRKWSFTSIKTSLLIYHGGRDDHHTIIFQITLVPLSMGPPSYCEVLLFQPLCDSTDVICMPPGIMAGMPFEFKGLFARYFFVIFQSISSREDEGPHSWEAIVRSYAQFNDHLVDFWEWVVVE